MIKAGNKGTGKARLRAVRRRQRGQALVETSVGLCVLVPLFVGLIMLVVNLYFVTTYGTKAQVLANEIAKLHNSNQYWLGMQRPDYNPDAAEAKAQQMAVTLAHTLGIPGRPTVVFAVDSGDPQADITTCTVSFVCGLPFACGGMLPASLPISVTSVAVHPKDEVLACVDIGWYPDNNDASGYERIRIPAYAIQRMPAGDRSTQFANNLLPGGEQESYGLGHVFPRYFESVSLNRTSIQGPNSIIPELRAY